MPCLPRESLQPGRGWHQHGVNLVDNLGRAPDNIVSSNNIVHGCQFVRDVVLSGIWNLVTVMMEQQQGRTHSIRVRRVPWGLQEVLLLPPSPLRERRDGCAYVSHQ